MGSRSTTEPTNGPPIAPGLPFDALAAAKAANDQFAAVTRDGSVIVFSVEQRRRVVEAALPFTLRPFHLCLTAGGRPVAVAGNYDGLAAALDAQTGALLWERGDVQRLDSLAALPHNRVAVNRIAKPTLVLDAESGETVADRPKLGKLLSDGANEIVIGILASRHMAVALGAEHLEELWTRPLEGFSLNDVAYGPSSICWSEAGGPLRTFDRDGTERWRWQPPENAHVFSVAWDDHVGLWNAIVLRSDESMEFTLVRLGGEGDQASSLPMSPLPLGGSVFVGGGHLLAVADGRLFETDRLDEIWTFAQAPSAQ